MEEEEEEQGGGEEGGHWELWLGTADWELWDQTKCIISAKVSGRNNPRKHG